MGSRVSTRTRYIVVQPAGKGKCQKDEDEQHSNASKLEQPIDQELPDAANVETSQTRTHDLVSGADWLASPAASLPQLNCLEEANGNTSTVVGRCVDAKARQESHDDVRSECSAFSDVSDTTANSGVAQTRVFNTKTVAVLQKTVSFEVPSRAVDVGTPRSSKSLSNSSAFSDVSG
eukprot:TRINITY_DN73629_c0_g1_i1.p1 TRINITY_DN73629_c0_g1~~TRINITY_DN73629_c0_g1_i1.p1  ORF type:complete len:176 (-),score=24.12 TRINITY_DN73629_c0_g1_i1:94-621(-)